METDNRIAAFHAAVDERFAFLAELGYKIVERRSLTDRYGSVRFKSESSEVQMSWDAYDGDIAATIDGRDAWAMLVAAGDWRGNGYQGFAVEAMQHGLDRIATFLRSHPEALQRS
jgi:hypothetical protein